MGKRYDMERTCENDAAADYKIKSVLDEYKDNPS